MFSTLSAQSVHNVCRDTSIPRNVGHVALVDDGTAKILNKSGKETSEPERELCVWGTADGRLNGY